MRRIGTTLTAIVLMATACTGGSAQGTTGVRLRFQPGGTLKLAIITPRSWPFTFDPQRNYSNPELFRCCLIRTLMSYNGKPADQGGAVIRPDLAASQPDVSPDGLTWTFHLKKGIQYAPPFEDREIEAQDFITALKREAKVGSPANGGYSFYYSPIVGFDDYANGQATSISGLRAVDSHTLVVRLREPTGDLGYRMALPATAPIPAEAAKGHADYGRFLVSSGPYMFEGSQKLDFSIPANRQQPVAGYTPILQTKKGQTQGSITLVRNPSWKRSTDPLRAAYVDRVEVSLAFDIKNWSAGLATFRAAKRKAFARVESGALDIVLDTNPPRAVQTDPQEAGRSFVNEASLVDYISMNLAVPPLDDIHVRRALNLAIDKAGLRQRWGALSGPIPEAGGSGFIADHLAPDGVEGGLLLDYRPSWITPSAGGDVRRARAEMRLSGYDRNHDGICDAQACRHVSLVETSVWPRSFDPLVERDFKRIGVDLQIRRYDPPVFYSKDGPLSPGARSAMVAINWGNDYPSGSAFFPDLFYGPNLRSSNPVAFNDFSLLGATNRELRRWGYSLRDVPTIDDRISQCDATPEGDGQTRCWADLDRYLMEKIVPWVPFLFQGATRLVSRRVQHYSFDQFSGAAALDQIALTRRAIEGAS
jgi:peptide/nickel transport system substrate-binding protein